MELHDNPFLSRIAKRSWGGREGLSYDMSCMVENNNCDRNYRVLLKYLAVHRL